MYLRFPPAISLCLLLSPAFAAEQDALAIDANIQARHMPYGTILDPVLSLPDLSQVVDYTRCGDSAIWTGHYLAAEAFRYKVTQSADALINIQNAIAAIDTLINVTGGDVLSRCGSRPIPPTPLASPARKPPTTSTTVHSTTPRGSG